MFKIKLLNRGLNSRRLRKINSATDLVGETVVVSDGVDASKTEVDAVKVNADDTVDIDLANGDQLNLMPEEASELVETGEVAAEDATIETEDKPESSSRKKNDDEVEVEEEVAEPKEFTVSRDVVDDNGDTEAVVTTKVDAADKADAIDKVKMIDSRRKRNCRHYRFRNSDTVEQTKPEDKPEDKPAEDPTKVNCDMQEFKVQRNCGDGKRKIASVTAPSLEEAIDAVKAKDAKDGIKADGYAELAEELPKINPVINSDVEAPAEPASDGEGKEGDKPATEDEKSDEEERKENSFKGVSDYVKRAYGINI